MAPNSPKVRSAGNIDRLPRHAAESACREATPQPCIDCPALAFFSLAGMERKPSDAAPPLAKSEVTGDASAHLFGALASGLGAMHRLTVDSSLLMQSCQAEMEKSRPGDGEAEKLAERAARNAAGKLPWAIDRLVAQRVWRMALIAAGVLIGTNLLTAGGMYLWLKATLVSLDARLVAAEAGRWRDLITANPGDLINQERGQCSPQQGGAQRATSSCGRSHPHRRERNDPARADINCIMSGAPPRR